jgi:hypothetical protein
MTSLEMASIVKDVFYPGHVFIVDELDPGTDRYYLQIRFARDGQIWHGRKWILSKHMTKGEIVQTALKAAITASEHEVREHFEYKGRKIFDPHFDIDRLATVCEEGARETRE